MPETYVIITDQKLAEPGQVFTRNGKEYTLLTVKQNADGTWSHECKPS